VETLVSNNEIKFVKSLSQKKFRYEYKLFVVEGRKLVAEARSSGFHIERSYRVEDVGENAMSRLSQLSSPSPAIAVVRQFPSVLEDGFEVPGKGLFLALDGIRDPGNLGTILRTADWFGVRHIVCSADTVSCFNPKVVQASMGAVFRTQVEYVDLPQWLAGCGMPVYGASLQGRPLDRAALPDGPSVLLIGNESRGIGPAAMAQVSHPILIPNRGGTAESLNAAVAAGILLNAFTQ
jgi:TrmH family RNA methyltransferase